MHSIRQSSAHQGFQRSSVTEETSGHRHVLSIRSLMYLKRSISRPPYARVAAYSIWLVAVIALSFHHVVWRDEVRAMSLALTGANLLEMFKAIHGEGHPAIWYMLIRGSHFILHYPWILKVLSVSVAAAAMAIFVFLSPFSLGIVSIVLLSQFSVFEYSVMARNYGLSMLVVFAFMILYEKNKSRGFVLGGMLLLLANTNAHSVILVVGLLAFWLGDISLNNTEQARQDVLKNYFLNVLIAFAGIAICALTILPTFNDAAVSKGSYGGPLEKITRTVFLPGRQFSNLAMPVSGPPTGLRSMLRWVGFSVLLAGATLGLVRRPNALVAALLTLLGLSTFFSFIYEGGYRHEALFLIFLIAMYWTVNRVPSVTKSFIPESVLRTIETAGIACFVILMAVQAGLGIQQILQSAGPIPPSRAADFAHFIAERPDLRKSTIIADPDMVLETMPYYVDNPIYLVRQGKYGNVVAFTRKAKLSLSLSEFLSDAQKLRSTTHDPVIILLSTRLTDPKLPRIVEEGYDWTLSLKPATIQTFLKKTTKLASFAPATGDESYDVYLCCNNLN